MSEHSEGQQSPRDTTLPRSSFLKGSAVAIGAGALATTAGAGLAGAAVRKAPFNITGRAQATITFAAWGGPDAIKPFQVTMHKFMARNPSIKVNLIAIPATGWASLFETIITRIAAGNAPDIIRVAIEGIALFGSKNLALPLDPFMKRDTAFIEELRSDTTPEMWNALAYKGKQLALPFSWNNMMTWYNTQLMAQIGMGRPKDNWTADDFLAMCAKLKKMGKYGTLAPGAPGDGLFIFECWSMAANGANLLDASWTKSTALDPGNLTAWQFLHDLVWKYKYSPRPGAIPQATFFESGRLGTFFAGRWPLQTYILDKFCTPKGCPMDIQYFPILSGTRKTIIGIDGYPVIRTSKYPEAAWELSKFMSTKETMTDWMRQGTNIPCRRSLAYANWMSPPAHYREFWDSTKTGLIPVTSPPQYDEIDSATFRWFSKMMANEVTPKAALTGLDKDLKAILAKPA